MPHLNVFSVFVVGEFARKALSIWEGCRSDIELQLEQIERLIHVFALQPPTPAGTCEFETKLQDVLREIGRQISERVYNAIESDNATERPKRIDFEGFEFSCKNEKTKNRNGVGTLFGRIVLTRFSYEPLIEGREDRQKSFSPLELQLGIVAANATPALAEAVGRKAASLTQQEMLELLEREYRVKWSPHVLRRVAAAVSEGIGPHLEAAQKKLLLEWLKTADESKGRRKITLAVGRDGIMLPICGEKTYKEGAVGTITVYDRRGRRLGTIYLGQMPEPYQTTLSDELTRLLEGVLAEWKGHSPRLIYITDAGFHPTDYFHTVLSRMEHPQHEGQLLEWTRVVDFYHAAEYLHKLAQALFGKKREGHAWQQRMRHWMKHEPNAIFRILHSATYYASQRVLNAKQQEEYRKAYQYLNNHKGCMDYKQYLRLGVPIGSGITEAACKTVFTQRFKQSGMAWGIEGGKVVLILRLAKLSRIWAGVYSQYLATRPLPKTDTNSTKHTLHYQKAA